MIIKIIKMIFENFKRLGLGCEITPFPEILPENETQFLFKQIGLKSAEILNIGTSPKEILEAPGVNNFWEFYGFISYTSEGTAFVISGGGVDRECIKYNLSQQGTYFNNFLQQNVSGVAFFNSYSQSDASSGGGGTPTNQVIYTDSSVLFTTQNGLDFQSGNGKVSINIWYRKKQF